MTQSRYIDTQINSNYFRIITKVKQKMMDKVRKT